MDKRRIDGFADGFAMDKRRIDGFATDVPRIRGCSADSRIYTDSRKFAKVRESSREFATVDADAPTDRRRIDDRFAD